MQKTLSVLKDDKDYMKRLRRTQRIWAGEILFPIAPVSFPDGATEAEREEFRESQGLPLICFEADQLSKDGDIEDARGDFRMDDTIFEGDSFEFMLDFPLESPAHLHVEGVPEGKVTPALIASLVKEAFEEIYRIEDQGANIPPSQILPSGITLANRPATDGLFGISLHSIHDLVIEEIELGDAGNGHAMLRISIGS